MRRSEMLRVARTIATTEDSPFIIATALKIAGFDPAGNEPDWERWFNVEISKACFEEQEQAHKA